MIKFFYLYWRWIWRRMSIGFVWWEMDNVFYLGLCANTIQNCVRTFFKRSRSCFEISFKIQFILDKSQTSYGRLDERRY
jgi:hypothetical protein